MIPVTTHRWTSSTRLKRHNTGETIKPGETFEPTESELRAFGNQIEEVDDDPVPADLDGETGTLPLNPKGYTIPELEEELTDVDDREELIAVGNLESEQQDRDGALEAVEARIAELENDED